MEDNIGFPVFDSIFNTPSKMADTSSASPPLFETALLRGNGLINDTVSASSTHLTIALPKAKSKKETLATTLKDGVVAFDALVTTNNTLRASLTIAATQITSLRKSLDDLEDDKKTASIIIGEDSHRMADLTSENENIRTSLAVVETDKITAVKEKLALEKENEMLVGEMKLLKLKGCEAAGSRTEILEGRAPPAAA